MHFGAAITVARAELTRRGVLRQPVTLDLPLRNEDAIHSKARAVGTTLLIGPGAAAESTVSPRREIAPFQFRDGAECRDAKTARRDAIALIGSARGPIGRIETT